MAALNKFHMNLLDWSCPHPGCYTGRHPVWCLFLRSIFIAKRFPRGINYQLLHRRPHLRIELHFFVVAYEKPSHPRLAVDIHVPIAVLPFEVAENRSPAGILGMNAVRPADRTRTSLKEIRRGPHIGRYRLVTSHGIHQNKEQHRNPAGLQLPAELHCGHAAETVSIKNQPRRMLRIVWIRLLHQLLREIQLMVLNRLHIYTRKFHLPKLERRLPDTALRRVPTFPPAYDAENERIPWLQRKRCGEIRKLLVLARSR